MNKSDLTNLFQKLQLDRTNDAKVLNKSNLRGVKKIISDNYSDQAHFIYELLQNADDARATTVRFLLGENGLIMAHNGSVRFTVSDPETEEKDAEEGKLGHINALCSIGQSTKILSADEPSNRIGKFGIGFKSVFTYTSAPHIYDPNFWFKVEEMIRPTMLEEDHPERKSGETLFFFPFDLPEDKKPKEKAFYEVLEKLQNLTHPLLFLYNLEKISWECGTDLNGLYTKKITDIKAVGPIRVQLAELYSSPNKGDLYVAPERICLFRETIAKSETGPEHEIATGFIINEDGSLSWQDNYPAYCYFKTLEVTNLKFIIQAPFLLTNTRTNIKTGLEWNEQLINELAVLAANALPILRDLPPFRDFKQAQDKQEQVLSKIKLRSLITDELLNLIPTSEIEFPQANHPDKVSFRPFYDKIAKVLKEEKVLPTLEGSFTSLLYACWADNEKLLKLLSSRQLAMWIEKPNASWVFSSFDRRRDSVITNYLTGELKIDAITPDKLARKLKPQFLNKQNDKWMKGFYAYLEGVKELWERPKAVLRQVPFIRLHNDKLKAPFNKADELQVYLPVGRNSYYYTIKQCFLEDESSAKFFTALKVKEPEALDSIRKAVLAKYDSAKKLEKITEEDSCSHLDSLLHFYYKTSSQEKLEDFIEEVVRKDFKLWAINEYSGAKELKAPKELYLKSQLLAAYFSGNLDVWYLDDKLYSQVIDTYEGGALDFILKLGMEKLPRILSYNIAAPSDSEIQNRNVSNFSFFYFTRNRGYNLEDYKLDGLELFLAKIAGTPEISQTLWEVLCELLKNRTASDFEMLNGRFNYFYNTTRSGWFKSSFIRLLRASEWLMDDEGSICSPSELTLAQLPSTYTYSSLLKERIQSLLNFAVDPDEERWKDLSEQEQQILRLMKLTDLNLADFTVDDIRILNQLKAISRRAAAGRARQQENRPEEGEESYIEADDFTSPGISMDELLGRLEEEFAEKQEKLTKVEELQQLAQEQARYTYGWFNALLGLEQIQAMEHSNNSRELVIHFGRVELDQENNLILSQPSRQLPLDIEELENLTVVLKYQDLPRSIEIEAAQLRNNHLLVKVKNQALLRDINFSFVDLATISVKDPGFLLETLANAFANMTNSSGSQLDDSFDMQQNLPSNMAFVFGPPGTGKTTRLGRYLRLLMNSSKDLKVLVLTPTNRAADELCKSVMKGCTKSNSSYAEWLFRFVQTNDPEVQGIVRNRDEELREDRAVLVSTIARFPFDAFRRPGVSNPLRFEYWDVVIFDEASMIGLAPVVYAIYQTLSVNPNCRFVVGGDPFQIEPIQALQEWQNKDGQTENIYSLVGLNDKTSFLSPSTIPHDYKVHRLMTQYRSLPVLGKLFSDFTYNGLLKHARLSESAKETGKLDLDIKPITFIPFPVRSYTRLYKAGKLGQTPYHIHSAILAAEMTVHLAKQLQANYMGMEGPKPNANYQIGVICPYRAQANLIENLVNKLKPSMALEKVDFHIGTVHTFQGGECDLVLAVLNPPANILHHSHAFSKNIFLNKQNLLNVAVSRARDYLLVLLPDSETKNIQELKLLNKLVGLAKAAGDQFTELAFKNVEKELFQEEEYLAKNSFISGHQSVNVYRKVTGRYEIRCDDTAIDVQIVLDEN